MAKNIFRGTTEINNIYRGNTEVQKVYSGQTEIWAAAIGTPDADAFIAQVILDGGTLSATQQSAIQQLETDLRATPGLYSKLHAIYPLVGGGPAASKYNLKGAASSFTYTLGFNGSWLYPSTGVTVGNTTSYADTFLSPSGIVALGTGIGVHLYLTVNNQAVTQYDFGANSQALIMGFGNTTLYANFVSRPSDTYKTVAAAVTGVGDLYSSQHDANGTGNTSNWKNGTSLLSSAASGFTSTEALSFYLGNDNRFDQSPNEGGNKGYGFGCLSSYLDSTEMTGFNTAVQTYNSTLGR